MNIERTWLWGGAGGVVGLLLGIAIAGDGREARAAAERAQHELVESLASVSETVGRIDRSLSDLGGRVSGIESSVKQVGEQQTGVEALSQRLDEVGADLQGAVSELGGAVSDVGSSVTKSLTERMEGLRTALAGVGGRARGAAGSEAGADEPAAAPAGAGAGAGAGEVVAMGTTVALGDGAVRVFLSGVDPEAGTARVAINGPVATVVALGEAAEAGACSVTLTGFADTGATFEADCGGGAGTPAEAGASAGSEAPAPAAATGAGTAVAIGAAETLVDGQLRVFLSAVDAEAGTARVAVNGPTASVLTIGTPVEAGGCTVTLTGIGDGQATIDGAC